MSRMLIVLVGVGIAGLDRTEDGLVGHVHLVAVDPAWRRRGVATALVRELVGRCEALGVASHLTYASVYGPDGTAPLARVLEEAGFSLSHRIESFYSGVVGVSCPVCRQSPCECPADLYPRVDLGQHPTRESSGRRQVDASSGQRKR